MSHNARVVSQFTHLASAFAEAPQFTDTQALDHLLLVTEASDSDMSLDVACGAGVVACHFAARVQRATGIDITPAMIEKAKERQERLGLTNAYWDVGDVTHLPYQDASFSIVTSRYAIHHIQSPEIVLREMMRVCRDNGRIAIADICVPENVEEADLFNRIERMNDPSHVRALNMSEWMSLFQAVGIRTPVVSRYKLEFPLARMLRASNHSKESVNTVERLVRAAIEGGYLSDCARLDGEECLFGYPIAVISGFKGVANAP